MPKLKRCHGTDFLQLRSIDKKKQPEKLMRLGKRRRKQKKEAPKITNSLFQNKEKSGDQDR